MKFHVKKGDEVVVHGRQGKGQARQDHRRLSKKQRVIVEGVQMIKRHTRKSQQHPQGAIVEREGTIHISNVMPAEISTRAQARRDANAHK